MATVTTNTYVGVWNPNSGLLPTIKSGIQFAQYFVTDSGTSSDLGISFDDGDWLIYLVDDSNVGHWYKTSAGVVTVSTIGSSSNQNAPAADWYTKVYVNAAGKITDAKSIESADLPSHTHSVSDIPDITTAIWPAVKSTFQNQKLGNVKFDIDDELQKITAHIVTDEETIDTNENGQLYATGVASGTVPSDIVTQDQITGFISKDTLESSVWPIISSIFQNQKLGNVKFSVDEKTKKITAAVVVDKETIDTNELGQLYSIVNDSSGTQIDLSNASFTISQVVNLESELTSIKNSISSISTTSGIVDVNDIPIDESTIIIDSNGNLSAVAQKNQAHTHVMDDITDLPQEYAAVAATKQTIESDTQDMSVGYFNFKNQKLDYAISSINKYLSTITNALSEINEKAGKISPVKPSQLSSDFSYKITNDTVQAYNKLTGEIENCYYGGNISIKSIDGIFPYNEGTLFIYIDGSSVETLSLSEVSKDSSNVSSGNFTYSVKDAYTDENYTGFYYTLNFSWSYKSTLSNGMHTMCLKQKLSDGTILSSSTLQFGVVNSLNGIIDDSSISIKGSYNSNDSYVSGVPRCTSSSIANTLKYDIKYTDTYIPIDFVTSDSGASVAKSYNSESITGTITESFSQKDGTNVTSFILKDFDGVIIYNEMFSSPNLHFDSTKYEKYRVLLSDSKYIAYDASKELPEGSLVIVNGNASVKNNQSYTAFNGPDYTKLAQIIEHDKQVREVVLRFNCTKFINNFYINLLQSDGSSFETNYDGTMNGIIIDSYITDSSSVPEWLSSIKSYDGLSSYEDSNFGTLDLFKSDSKIKYFTFGRVPSFTLGYLYVKIMLDDSYSLDFDTAVSSIIESLETQGNENE
jgi:hypothetical protein